MIETTEAIIVYDALSTVFDVLILGGGLMQKYNTLTCEYVPDRNACPIALTPRLTVTDPNRNDETTDQTSMIVVQWYRVTVSGSSETETEIISTSDEDQYYKSGRTLMVAANISAGNTVILRVKASYVNPHTNETMRFTKDFVLGTQNYVEFNPSLEIDAPNLVIVSPFKLEASNRYKTVTAKFFAGATDISTNANVVYKWYKMVNNAYREITSQTIANGDIDVSSVSGRTLVLDLFCIKKEKYCCTAYYDVDPYNRVEYKLSRYFTVNRQMSGYSLKPRVSVGKFLRMDMKKSTAEAVLTVNSHQMDDPSQFFVISWKFYLQSGTSKLNTKNLGTGNSASVDRSLSGYDRTKIPTFEMGYEPLSEYGVVVDDQGDTIIDDEGDIIIAQTTE